MEHLNKCYKKSENVVDRTIDDEVVLVPIVKDLSGDGVIYNLDPVGSKIWQMIDGKKSVSQIRDSLTETMEVTPQQAEEDLAELFKDLAEIGAVEEVE